MKDKILKQFDANKQLYERFGDSVKNYFLEILDPSIFIHTISMRVKERDSLSKKINRKNNKYSDINNITDVCGIRIITFLDSDVERIGKAIDQNFELDLPNCSNKREIDFDRFGYRSMHYVLSYKEEKLRLPGLRPFSGLKLEAGGTTTSVSTASIKRKGSTCGSSARGAAGRLPTGRNHRHFPVYTTAGAWIL